MPGERRDHREDADPDRERAGRPEAVVDDPALVEVRRSRPLVRARAHHARRTGRRRRAPAATAPTQSQLDQRRPPARIRCERHASTPSEIAKHEEEHGELRADEGGEHAARRRRAPTDARVGAIDRAQGQEEREGARRVGERLLDEDRRVRERRRGHRRDRGEQRPGPRDDEPGECVRGEDRRRHHQRLQVLDRLERVDDAVEPPGGRRQPGDERGEAVGDAAASRLARVGDRPRDLGQLELVGEDRRRLAPPGLPDVQRGERAVREEQRDEVSSASGRAPPRVRSLGGHFDERRLRSRCAGARSGTVPAPRRRPGRPASSRSRGALGIETSTSSGRAVTSTVATSSVAPSTVTPWIRRRRSAGLSSRKPTTRASGSSRSSRTRLRPARPAPTTSTRRRSPRARSARRSGSEPQQRAART